MYNIFFSFLILASPFIAMSQNVGIGTISPTAKLTVAGTETTTNGQGAAIKIQNSASTLGNAWYLRAGASGNTTPNDGFSIADNLGYHFIMTRGGNLGLGITPTNAKLDINGNAKIQGSNTLEFGADVAGKEINAGKIGYNIFSQSGLSIVGGGTTVSNRKVWVYAEGGADFNGPLNINGPLSVNGSAGLPGQVLTSNGAGDPVWRNASFNNDTRFAATSEGSFATVGALSNLPLTTRYNLNTSNIVFGTNTITVNKSGLYHIEGFFNISLTGLAVSKFLLVFNMVQFTGVQAPGSPGNMFFASEMQDCATCGATSALFPRLRAGGSFNIEVYITAGQKIAFLPTFTPSGTYENINYKMDLRGHLISE